MSAPPLDTFSISNLTLLQGRAEDLYRKLGFAKPFLSAVELWDVLLCRGLPPYCVAIEIASIASVMKWPFHDIHQHQGNPPTVTGDKFRSLAEVIDKFGLSLAS